jgi:ADP-dependent NAD(P)H-hydrate dehydratase / NAD(P)H-hydrate epimerase
VQYRERRMQSGLPLHDAETIRACDQAAITRLAIPGLTLMRHAAQAVADTIVECYPDARRVVCVSGAGNNGGDGFWAARLLKERGIHATIALASTRPPVGDAAEALAAARDAGVAVHRVATLAEDLDDADVVIDALLGTGFTGEPRGAVADAIGLINAAGRPVVSVDIPSGVDASTGEVPGVGVTATRTVTFHAEKIGLRVAPGLIHAGVVAVAPIGIPREADHPAAARIATAALVETLAPRGRFGSKYDAGSVLLVGGSVGLTGAISLAARAALRAGAGIVTAAVPESLNAILEVKLTEPMTLPCPDQQGSLTAAAADPILAAAARFGSVVIGPGIGRHPETARLVRRIVAAITAPIVVDADGLHALAAEPELLAGREAATIITPHAGEAARLLGCDRGSVDRRRLASARALASRAGAVCVLKGADTLIVTPDGGLTVRDGDDRSLATAGAGDVLAGIIGALLARGAPACEAAAAATVAHLAAARSATARFPRRGIIAGDLIEQLALG